MDDIHPSAGAITVRQLARKTTAVIDWVRERGKSVLITRNGVPVAMIQPLEFDTWFSPARTRAPIPEMEGPEIDWEALGLGDRERGVLPHLGDAFTQGDVGIKGDLSSGQSATACACLEIKGLAMKTLSGYRLTKFGRQVRGSLQAVSLQAGSRQAGENNSDPSVERP